MVTQRVCATGKGWVRVWVVACRRRRKGIEEQGQARPERPSYRDPGGHQIALVEDKDKVLVGILFG
jgi:hypothetical protein